MSLEIYRNQLDEIDKSLVSLLEKRMLVCGLIGRIKRRSGNSTETLDRQDEIPNKLKKHKNKMKLSEILRVYETIFDISKKYEDKKPKSIKAGLPIKKS